MKQFISVKDAGNVNQLVQEALAYKQSPWKDAGLGKNKRLGMLFLNPSMRTRLSTQVAASQLGLDTIVFNMDKEGWKLEFNESAIMDGDTVEHIKDAAPILGQYFDILALRSFPAFQNREEDYQEEIINQFIKYSGIPVVSLESATRHPLQSLTDILTMTESMTARNMKRRPKVVLSWAPHVKALPQCVANSFAEWVNAWGEAEFVVAHPRGYELDEQFTQGAEIIHQSAEALKDADFVYVKNWSSYQDYGKILSNDPSWMITLDKLAATNDAKVMHCLPVRRNVELSGEVLDSPSSLVNQEAGNRVWAAQAVLARILKNIP